VFISRTRACVSFAFNRFSCRKSCRWSEIRSFTSISVSAFLPTRRADFLSPVLLAERIVG
jgi:hypothetical protein